MSPLDIQDILERAKGSARVGDHEEAERLLKQYLAKEKDSREARLLLGTTLAKAGKFSGAEDEFTTLLAGNPRDVEALNNLAVIYRRQDRLQDALDALMKAIDIDPTRAEFHYNLGNIHKQMGNLKAASMTYAKVVELDPAYVHAYNNLGTIYDKLHEWDKAFNVFRKGLALDQNNPTLHFNYGLALEANGRLADAANAYKAALRSRPGWFDAMNNLGIVYFKQGRHNKALEVFNRILKIDPFNAEARNNMGVVYSDQGRHKEAVQNFRQALESDPKYVKAVVNMERALEDQGDFADAVVELEKLVKLVPDSADIRNRLASLYIKMERYPEALEQAKAAQEWEPENVQSLRLEGTAQRIMGNDEAAKVLFEKVLAVDPGNFAFHLDLADIHFRRKEYKEAEERIMAFLTRKPNDRGAKVLLGKLYAEMGNRTHAIQIFEELARADPNDTEALAAAAALHKEAGSLEKALRTADKLVNLQGKRGTSDDLSDLNKSLEFYENAVSAYSSSVQEMWDRNMKLIAGESAAEAEEDTDIGLLMGTAGVSQAVDEEIEELFIEDIENSKPENDVVIDDEDEYPILDDAEDISLDHIAEPEAAPVTPYPSGGPLPDLSGLGPFPQNGVPPQPDQPLPQPPSPAQTPPMPSPQQAFPPQSFPPAPFQPEEALPSTPSTPMPSTEPPPSPDQALSPTPPPPQQAFPPQGFPPAPPSQPDQALPPTPSAPPPPPPEQTPPPRFPPSASSKPPRTGPEDWEIPFDAEPEEPYSVSAEEAEIIPGEVEEEISGEEFTADENGDGLPRENDEGEIPAEESFEETIPEESLFGEELPEDFTGETAEEPELSGDGEFPELPVSAVPEEAALEASALDDEAAGLAGQEGPAPEDAPLPPPAQASGRPEAAKTGPQAENMLGLMRYLKSLAGSLPDKNRAIFMQSDARVSMEYIIDSLEGRKGLFKGIQERLPEKIKVPSGETSGRVKTTDVAGTLSFLGRLASALPDQGLSTAITRKVNTVITGIRSAAED
ncbi:MAG: tetratricopeptide repeat protein [Treponema sp.]|jgi:tetratricopeptide (TPR) repeat protein|nr:tetratricopeptide repeat protein [Treponema sp.]